MRRFAMLLLLLFATIPGAQAAEPPTRKFVVFFQEWSVAIDDAAESVISQAATFARDNPNRPVRVTGFADPTGTRKSNILLSELRAQRVADYLMQDGVPEMWIKMRGKGPVLYAISSVESRRVEISIQGK